MKKIKEARGKNAPIELPALPGMSMVARDEARAAVVEYLDNRIIDAVRAMPTRERVYVSFIQRMGGVMLPCIVGGPGWMCAFSHWTAEVASLLRSSSNNGNGNYSGQAIARTKDFLNAIIEMWRRERPSIQVSLSSDYDLVFIMPK